MKKLALAAVVLLSLAPAAFAQTAKAPAAAVKPAVVAPAAVQPKVISGKVDALVVADPVKGTKSSLEITTAQGQKALFQVGATVAVTDAAGKTVALGSLANSTPVLVAYVVQGAAHEAVAIKVVK